MGLADYYYRFMPNVSSAASTLSDLTRKGHPEKVQWTSKVEFASQALKRALTTTPVLHNPDFNRPFILCNPDRWWLKDGMLLLTLPPRWCWRDSATSVPMFWTTRSSAATGQSQPTRCSWCGLSSIRSVVLCMCIDADFSFPLCSQATLLPPRTMRAASPDLWELSQPQPSTGKHWKSDPLTLQPACDPLPGWLCHFSPTQVSTRFLLPPWHSCAWILTHSLSPHKPAYSK